MTTLSPITRLFGHLDARWRALASTAFLALGAVEIGVNYLLSGAAQALWFEVIGVSSVAAVCAALAWTITVGATAWRFLGFGLALQIAGDIATTYYEVHLGHEPPVPAVVDAFYLGGYPFYAIGILLLLREFGGQVSRAAVLDALLVFVAVGTLQWIFVVQRFVHDQLPLGQKLVEVAYPSMDVLLLVVVAELVIGATQRTAPFRLLVIAVGLRIAADEVFLLSSGYSPGGASDVLFLSSYVVWGAAALRLAPADAEAQEREALPRLTWTVIAFALVSVPVFVAVERVRGHSANIVLGAVGVAVMAAIVVLRLGGLLRALDSQNRQLRELDRLKDEFVATVSHELRTPLTSISGYVQLLDDERSVPLTPEQRSHFQVVARNTERLLNVVNDLLFVAGMQNGGLQLRIEDVDLARIAAEAVEASMPAADGHAAVVCESEGATRVRGDRIRLGQMIENLVSNAIKFSPSGGRVVVRTIGTRGAVRLEVIDSGIGIAADEQGYLFERFFRARAAVSQASPGTGLGLYITKAIAEAHHGHIEFESVEGRGSVFRVSLPAVPPAA